MLNVDMMQVLNHAYFVVEGRIHRFARPGRSSLFVDLSCLLLLFIYYCLHTFSLSPPTI